MSATRPAMFQVARLHRAAQNAHVQRPTQWEAGCYVIPPGGVGVEECCLLPPKPALATGAGRCSAGAPSSPQALNRLVGERVAC